jgi:hypothetical protein
MTTIIIKNPAITVGTTTLGKTSVPQAEVDINNNVATLAWWRADVGVNGAGSSFVWSDRKKRRRMTPFRSPYAPTPTANAINGKTALVFATGSAMGELADPDGQSLLPTSGDWTIATVCKCAAAANSAVFGNTLAIASAAYLLRRSDEKIEARIAGSQVFITPSAYTAGAAFLAVLSYEQATRTLVLRVNGTQTNSVAVAAGTNNTESTLHLGAVGTTAAQSAPMSLGAFAEAMVFSAALGNTANASLLANVESYLKTRYAV